MTEEGSIDRRTCHQSDLEVTNKKPRSKTTESTRTKNKGGNKTTLHRIPSKVFPSTSLRLRTLEHMDFYLNKSGV